MQFACCLYLWESNVHNLHNTYTYYVYIIKCGIVVEVQLIHGASQSVAKMRMDSIPVATEQSNCWSGGFELITRGSKSKSESESNSNSKNTHKQTPKNAHSDVALPTDSASEAKKSINTERLYQAPHCFISPHPSISSIPDRNLTRFNPRDDMGCSSTWGFHWLCHPPFSILFSSLDCLDLLFLDALSLLLSRRAWNCDHGPFIVLKVSYKNAVYFRGLCRWILRAASDGRMWWLHCKRTMCL